MNIDLQVEHLGIPISEVRDTILIALQSEAKQAQARLDYYAKSCHEFEQKHHLTSDEFMTQFDNGDLGDDAIYFDWYAAKRSLDVWKRRYHILSQVTL